MSGLIPREFIDDLLTRVDIIDVVGRRLPLKKKGKDYWACCPFHGEKSPSFSVSQSKQFYKCFGCGLSGNAISFIMENDHCDFVTAIETLADIAGVSVPREQNADPQAGLRAELHDLLAEVSSYFQARLRGPSGANALAYLKKRGVTGEVIQRYGLGCAEAGWDSVLKAFGSDVRRRDLLVQGGLLIKKDDRYFDFFRERLMFPVRDARGRTIAFGGRIMDKGEPKYLNSPETPIFHKGQELYGLYEAKQARGIIERAMLVEGYMDVVALAQYGINYAVAALGTAATKTHLESLFKMCPEIVCCFDGDEAGKRAAWRALNHALGLQREGRQVKFLFLPDGEDPDSLVRKEGKDNFEKRLAQHALPLSTYLFEELAKQTDSHSVDGRAKLAALVKPLLGQIEDPVYKTLLEQELEHRIGLRRESRPTPAVPAPARARAQRQSRLKMTPMLTLISMMLQYPELVGKRITVTALSELLGTSGADLLNDLAAAIHDYANINTGRLLTLFSQHPQLDTLHELAGWPHHFPEKDQITGAPCTEEQGLKSMFDAELEKLLSEIRVERAQDIALQLEVKVSNGTATGEEKAAWLRALSKPQSGVTKA